MLPLVTFRRKSAYESVSVKTQGFDIITDTDLVYEIRLNGSLTGESYGTPTDHTASETALRSTQSSRVGFALRAQCPRTPACWRMITTCDWP